MTGVINGSWPSGKYRFSLNGIQGVTYSHEFDIRFYDSFEGPVPYSSYQNYQVYYADEDDDVVDSEDAANMIEESISDLYQNMIYLREFPEPQAKDTDDVLDLFTFYNGETAAQLNDANSQYLFFIIFLLNSFTNLLY